MIIEPTVLSLIVAKLRKGKIKNLEKIEIKAWYLLLIAASIQIISSIFKKNGLIFESGLFFLHILSYILILICILLNLNKNSMKAFLIGVVLNFIVIFANGGKMPVSLNGIKGINDNISTELPMSDYDIKHQGVTSDTKFVYLSDIILIPKPYPLPKILSIGDIFIMIGLFIFIQEAMVIDEKKLKSQL
ncbi:MAG: DUF5317 domain-containing protein [Tissierellaceae bacterium]|nr:DUF5317 domain-containing protein [Tissierellaceae bacterium]